MNDQLSIDTPEQIELNYRIAGVGSRFCAAFIDTCLIAILLAFGWFVIIRTFSGDGFGGILSSWFIAIMGVVTFAILWGYYIVFDLITNGQSPGKRLLKLRVIKENGYPVSFVDSAIRNLVRIVDFLPGFYGIGVVAMMLDRKWRRLGDLAAGTLVIREGAELIPNQLATPVAAKKHFTYADAIQPDQVTEMELSTIREYLSRRRTLSIRRRSQLARTIGAPMAQRMGLRPPIDYDLFLEEIFALAIDHA